MQSRAVEPELAQVMTDEQEAAVAVAARKFEEAVLRHQAAIRRAAPLHRPRLVAVLHARLAETLRAAGELDASLVAYESAMRALEELPEVDTSWRLRTMSLFHKIFDPDRVFDLPVVPVEPMLARLEDAEADPRLVVRLLLNIATGYLEQPQERIAEGFLQEALGHAELAGEPRLLARAKTLLALIRLADERADEAEALLREALALLDAGPERRHAVSALAGLHAARGDSDGALARFTEALALHRAAGDAAAEVRVLAGIAQLHFDRGQLPEATSTFEQAHQAAARVQDLDARAVTAWGLARCKLRSGALDEAAKLLQDSLAWIDEKRGLLLRDEAKVRYLGGTADVHELLVSVHVDRAREHPAAWQDALSAAERARGAALRDMMLRRSRRRFGPEPDYAAPPEPIAD